MYISTIIVERKKTMKHTGIYIVTFTNNISDAQGVSGANSSGEASEKGDEEECLKHGRFVYKYVVKGRA